MRDCSVHFKDIIVDRSFRPADSRFISDACGPVADLMLNFSVIICAHNPRRDYLQRVLDALKAQTVPKDEWELLLIDNGSRQPMAPEWDLSWHPLGRVIREDELGLTPARLRGIRESRGALLVWVDDDNVLHSDYLAEASKIAGAYPFIGAWGGRILAEFDVPPALNDVPFLRYLAIRDVEEVVWVNTIDFYKTVPWGAGMCIRPAVANEYLSLVTRDPRRRILDRKGELIFAGGDSDMALCARRLGMGMGLFPSLKLAHLISEDRLRKGFLVRAAFGSGYTITLLNYLYGIRTTPEKHGLLRRGITFARLLGRSRLERQLAAEERNGVSAAWKLIQRWEKPR